MKLSNDFFFLFWGELHPWHMEVSGPGVKLGMQLPVYATATAMSDPRHIFNLHGSLWQHQILYPLIESRDRTRILMDTSWVLNLLSHKSASIY